MAKYLLIIPKIAPLTISPTVKTAGLSILERTDIVVNRKEGASFYYKIKDSNHLVMNLEKIYSEKEKTNRELFDRGYPAPSKAYELVKDTSFHIQE